MAVQVQVVGRPVVPPNPSCLAPHGDNSSRIPEKFKIPPTLAQMGKLAGMEVEATGRLLNFSQRQSVNGRSR